MVVLHKDWELKEYQRNAFGRLNALLDTKTSVEEKLTACFDYIEKNLKSNSFRGCRFINMMAEIDNVGKAMHQQILEHKAKLRKQIRQLVETILNRSDEDTREKADAIYLLLEEAIVESKIYKATWPVKVAKKTALMLLQ